MCDVLFVFYSNIDMDGTATFDHPVLRLAMLHDGGPTLSSGGKVLVSVHEWLKHGFGNTRTCK